MGKWIRWDNYTPLLQTLSYPQRFAFLRMCEGFAVSPGRMRITKSLTVLVRKESLEALEARGMCCTFLDSIGQLKAVRP